jgi:predicted RNase H-like HicB family nuclease
MKEFAFTVIIEPDNGSYHAYVPALKGCHIFGDTLEEAQANIVEAMQLHLESMLEGGEEIPEDIGSLMIQRLTGAVSS